MLVANIEEARYEALIGEDGKALVRARYAVRNNQRSFLAVSVAGGGDAVECRARGTYRSAGRIPDGQSPVAIAKGSGRETPPTVAVEIVYLQRTPSGRSEARRR